MRIGIIGLGNVAELHLTALKELDPDAYVGGWGRTAKRAELFVERFGDAFMHLRRHCSQTRPLMPS